MTNSAYSHYHAHYDNDAYHAVQVAIVRDLFNADVAADPDQLWAALGVPDVNDLLNRVTDAALHISSVPGYERALPTLAYLTVARGLSGDSVQAIADHLRRFERDHATAVDDWLAIVGVLRAAHEAIPHLRDAVSSASMIHSADGRAAYDLLQAVHALTEAATILPREGRTGYLREKLSRGVQCLGYARNEME